VATTEQNMAPCCVRRSSLSNYSLPRFFRKTALVSLSLAKIGQTVPTENSARAFNAM